MDSNITFNLNLQEQSSTSKLNTYIPSNNFNYQQPVINNPYYLNNTQNNNQNNIYQNQRMQI